MNSLSKYIAVLIVSICFASVVNAATPGRFEIGSDAFLLDGKPIQLISGEMHYPHSPRVLATTIADGAGNGIERGHHLLLLGYS